jgi:hypothetical protein
LSSVNAPSKALDEFGVEKCDWNEWLMWKWITRWETAVPGKADDVPREYATLRNYLTNRYADIVVLTFEEGQVRLATCAHQA